MAPPDNDVLWARSLRCTLGGRQGATDVLTGVSVNVREGEILAVVGPRGSGKTTLLRCLSGQQVTQEGEIWFNSVPVHTMNRVQRDRLHRDRFGWIGTEPGLVPELTAWENTALPLMLRGVPRRAAKTAAAEWLERLDIGASARSRPHALTPAQCQRIATARALITTPDVLFADEPTATLYSGDAAQVLRTLTAAARTHGITVLLATHDLGVAALADRTLALRDGRRVGSPAPANGAEGVTACSLSV
ncbi:ABC transporter ATP-binding protein [Streptomyces sp. NPDC048718]|uniref:ABC transporter ATP-binding protein n=1 Tax=Streptomyces sp. NPDC048718 TaxID=3365587 RepID=UPI0037235F56